MEEFYTRGRAEDGVKIPLQTPEGAKTDHYLIVCGIDSDRFRQADIKAKRKMLELAAETDDEKRTENLNSAKAELIASLVKDWSFDQECTRANVVSFLREAPQIMEQIDRVTANRPLFFTMQGSNSESTPESNSS